jgi:hypothetical protein
MKFLMKEEPIMSSPTISLAFEEFTDLAPRTTVSPNIGEIEAREPKPTLRITLICDEQLRIPNSSEWHLHILSGRAWVSFGGQDFYLGREDRLIIPRVMDGAIISAIGTRALFFEIT